MANVELTENRVIVDGCEMYGVARYDVTVTPDCFPVVTLTLNPPTSTIDVGADLFVDVGEWPVSVQRAVYSALKEKFDV